jgi:DNA invertase Pin-like site-specific DNA recombinase
VSQTIGYARVSAVDQNPDLQERALRAAGCDRIYIEKASGARKDRPELLALLDYARQGDVLVVYKLDRLARSLVHLIDTMNLLAERGIGFRSLSESMDMTTPTGKLMFHVFAAIAEFERDMIRERAAAGRAAAKARGETGGRPLKMTPAKLRAAELLIAGGASLRQAAITIDVSRATLSRHLVSKRRAAAEAGTEQSGQGFGTASGSQSGSELGAVSAFRR